MSQNDKSEKNQGCLYNLSWPKGTDAHPCTCDPDLSQCQPKKNPWICTIPATQRAPHEASLVAYIRAGAQQLTKAEQIEQINSYCKEHGFRIAETFADDGKPSFGLQDALQSAHRHDGLIAANLDCFVEHQDDRLRDLRPFIHHFFCNRRKHLITIQEGIDTASPAGQLNAIELASQYKEMF